MTMTTAAWKGGLIALAVCACGPQPRGADAAFTWQWPANFVEPHVPADNPMTVEKVELGRALFYDVRLSLNQTQACASCHQQALAFTDGRPRAIGSTGQVHTRGALSLVNAAWRTTYNWANGLLRTLEQQALVPLFNIDPIPELAMDGHEDVLLARLQGDDAVRLLFERAFPEQAQPISLRSTVFALACFVRSIVSADSPYDRFLAGDPLALDEPQRRGLTLFFGKARCSSCHSGIGLTDAQSSEQPFHLEGLYSVDSRGDYPDSDRGLFAQTAAIDDIGKFRTPTLRNIALTAPYMHDGSLQTLAQVIAHYADPFSLDATGAPVAMNPRLDPSLRGLSLSADERSDLEAFLNALTDQTLITDPRYQSPFP